MDFTGITITGGFNALPTTNVPGTPTVGTATATGSNSATVAFTAPASNGNSTIVSYTAISTPGNITGTLVQSGSGTITVNGLVPSTSYTFKVYATNSIGSGSLSSASNSITTSAPAINPSSWGTNQYYQLALSDTVNRSSPTQIGSTGDWNILGVGYRYTLAIKNNGSLWAVGGRADNGGFGLGSSIGYVSSPVQVGALTTWANVGVGYYTSTAIKTDGTLWSWGQFGSGPLNGASIGLLFGVSSPVLIGSDTDWVDIFQTQSFGLGIKTDNSLWAWGDNTYGQLGTNSPIGANSPIQVGNDTDWVNIGGGAYNALATRTNGTLWSWGNNSNGELGINSVILRSSPVQIGGLTNWYKIVKSSSGFFTTQTSVFATKTNGTLWGWGNNQFGSVGDNTVINRSSPVQIGTDTNWNNITTAGKVVTTTSTQFTIANRTDGTLWSWGGNQTGELGQNDLVYRSSPTQVGSSTTWVNNIGSGENYAMALNGSETAPSAPTILVAEAVTSTSVRVGVVAPIVTGTDGYVTYTATSSPGGFTGTLANKAGGGGIIVSNLIPGTSYTFTVTATNSIGTSVPSSASDSVIPVDVPNPTLNLYGWGYNVNGNLGDNTTSSKSSPVQLGSLSTWNKISLGNYASFAVKTDGTLWAWGDNDEGQLGLNDLINRSAPVQIGNDNNWNVIASGSDSGFGSTLAIKNNGTLWSWGANNQGQLGLSDTINRSSPVQIGTDTTWNIIKSGGYITAAIKTDGTLWTWGRGSSGALGNNSTGGRSSPNIVGASTTWTKIATISESMLAIRTNGTLWAWGRNDGGQLGLNDRSNRSSPVQVGTNTWIDITTGPSFVIGIQSDGTLWSWGMDSNGSLGLSDTINRSSPTQIGTDTNWNTVRGGNSLGAIKTNGTFWVWGNNAFGQLGLNDRLHRSSPVQVGTDTNWRLSNNWDGCLFNFAIKGTPAKPTAPSNPIATSTGQTTATVSFTRPLSDNGSDILVYTVTSTPDNIKAYSTVLGLITVAGLTPATSYTFTVTATNSVGESLPSGASNSITTTTSGMDIYAWGNNSQGQSGLNNAIHRSSPVQVGSSNTWNTLVRGYVHTLATKNDGTLWAWGDNARGAFGNNTTSGSYSPIQIGSLTNWAVLSGTYFGSYAVKTDGTLWSWGNNTNGCLGLDDTVHRSSPVQIGTDTDWADVRPMYGYAAFALKKDGTLWAWGTNGSGVLGINVTGGSRSSPVQVGTFGTSWKQLGGGGSISAQWTLALRPDGTLWGWGANSNGQLGINSAIAKSSPTQVGALTNWSKIFKTGGSSEYALAIKTDGTLWSWGANGSGQLGLSYADISRSTPVQIGTDSWKLANADDNSSIGVRSDNTIWTWGRNSTYGQLGLNDMVDRNSPVQVGSTSWGLVDYVNGGDFMSLLSREFLTTPSAPIIGNAYLSSNSSAVVEFYAPIDSGGSLITSYTATSSPGTVEYPLGLTATITSSIGFLNGGAINVKGLVPGATYTFTVTATNSSGTGVKSEPSNTVSTFASSATVLLSSGINDEGQLGINDIKNRMSPVMIQSASLPTWNKLASGRGHVLATMKDGTLWAWGRGNNGQLGNNASGTLAPRSNPTQIGALTNWAVISANNYQSYAIKTDGTLWAWGSNTNGQLGIETVVAKSSPVIVGADTDWVDVSAGSGDFVVALKANGTLWTWGQNTDGQLGLNDIISRSSPVQIGTSTTWEHISSNAYYTLAIKTDGTLWAWGNQASYVAYNGALGLNDIINRSSPVQVGALTDWSGLVKGGYVNPTSLAIKTDGTLWAWGYNGYGRIGDNTTVNKSSPVQVGSNTNWISVASGNENAAAGPVSAIKSDGTLWSWGTNTFGALGLNSIVAKSSPVQVGSDTNWIGSPTAGFGGGIIAVQGNTTLPDAPIIKNVYLSSATSVAIEYISPIDDGGSPITSYTATSSPGGFTSTVTRSNGGTIIVSGLSANTAYTFTVKATTRIGTSVASDPSSSITIPTSGTQSPSAVEYLVVGGGGGGANQIGGSGGAGGGGGAGGFRTGTGFAVTSGVALTVTIGAGGAGSTGSGPGVSATSSVFSTITSSGGGCGGYVSNGVGGNGASGGGACGRFAAGGTGTTPQGNNGGTGAYANGEAGGGGGGAGARGGDGIADGNSGNGGVGLESSISGTATYYAGGGGGGACGVYTAGVGGLGGGGAGNKVANQPATSGTANTGGGGGGGYGSAALSPGGSGIVILRYLDIYTAAASTTGSPTITVANGYRVYKWTSSGSITF